MHQMGNGAGSKQRGQGCNILEQSHAAAAHRLDGQMTGRWRPAFRDRTAFEVRAGWRECLFPSRVRLRLRTLIIFSLYFPLGTHSLRYFRLGVSDPSQGIPEFISVGYMDSHPITTYDSVSQLKEPKAPWMAENLAPDHWERYTQLLRGWQQDFLVELKQLQSHYNHSGIHTYQRMIGCEILEDGSTTGFLQYAYDGQDFIIFNKETLSWVALDSIAQIIKRAWEANRHELQYQKNWLEKECIAWLKRFLEYGKETLQRTEISMMWMKNGEEIVQEMEFGDVLPSGDGTYQMWVSVELDPQSGHYSCHVEHCGHHMVLQAHQELETLPVVVKAIFGFTVLAIIALFGVGVLVWRRRR
ncbi:Major histocompatibility complex class I-related gene protein, partial [Galemys pyrenaicus]